MTTLSAPSQAIEDEMKPKFDHFEAYALVLWRISGGSLNLNLSELDLINESSLSPMRELSEVFSEPPIRKHAPHYCEASASPRSSHFPFQLSSSKTSRFGTIDEPTERLALTQPEIGTFFEK